MFPVKLTVSTYIGLSFPKQVLFSIYKSPCIIVKSNHGFILFGMLDIVEVYVVMPPVPVINVARIPVVKSNTIAVQIQSNGLFIGKQGPLLLLQYTLSVYLRDQQ